jgi:hypothetical protein
MVMQQTAYSEDDDCISRDNDHPVVLPVQVMST